MTNSQLPILIIIVPLLAALAVNLTGWLKQQWCFAVTALTLLVPLGAAVALLSRVREQGLVLYRLAGWDPPWGIALQIDHLNALVLILIALVAFINLIATRTTVTTAFPNRRGTFYTLYLLFVTGLMGIVITGDAFNLYVLLEISSLSGYALLGMGNGRAAFSTLNYLFMGTIGASFYLLGIGYLYMITGSLNIADMAAILPTLDSPVLVKISFALCLIGLFIKMALFPLHAWLPNAYAHAPAPAASLIAPLTTKVMLYVMIRITLSLYQAELAFVGLGIADLIIWMAVIAIFFGSVMAFKQTRLKRLLGYLIVVEVGYMVGGFWLGNPAGITGAMLHLLNDAMMTLCVFLAAGAIVFHTRFDGLEKLAGLFGKMPFTMAAFVVGALSIIGIPPTCGFFSKWYLLTGGLAAGHYEFVAALIISSLINVLLFFKIFEIAYFEPSPDHHQAPDHFQTSVQEAPWDMVIPLMMTAGLLVVMGIYAHWLVTWLIKPAVSFLL